MNPDARPAIVARMEKDLKTYTPDELSRIMETYGQKRFLADYLFSFIHQKHVSSLAEISPLPKAFRTELIAAGYGISGITMLQQHHDPEIGRAHV